MKQDKRAVRILCLLGIVPVVWLGLLILRRVRRPAGDLRPVHRGGE